MRWATRARSSPTGRRRARATTAASAPAEWAARTLRDAPPRHECDPASPAVPDLFEVGDELRRERPRIELQPAVLRERRSEIRQRAGEQHVRGAREHGPRVARAAAEDVRLRSRTFAQHARQDLLRG